MDTFPQRRILGIFVRTDNTRYHAGNICLFKDHGPAVYLYGREAPGDDWAIRRVWVFFGLFAILHVSEGKSTSINGWHLLLPSLTIKKERGDYIIRFRRISLHGSVRSTRLERFKHWIRGDRFYQS